MKLTLKTLILSILLYSCSSDDVNNYIIPQEDLVPALIDFHIINAASKQGVISNNRNNLIRHQQYAGILEKHQFERARFDSTMLYYAQRPEEYKLIYEEVEAQIIRMLEQNQVD